jgi:hypothetical protein
VSSSAKAALYEVPASSYVLSITIDRPDWIVVRSPATSTALLVAETRLPSAGPLRLALHTSASITVAARTQSIVLSSGSRVLETIDDPALGVVYTFQPEKAST